jgi:NDP-sugar pyrophosphorylase family protein
MRAIILAGGKGERLRPLTNDRPKGMVEVAGRPILEYQVAWLKRHGIEDVTISCGYLAEVIQRYFGDGRGFGVQITYAIEAEPLGRGGGFRLAMGDGPGSEPIVGTNGDIVTNLDLAAVLRRHQAHGVMATDVLAPLQSPYGIVDLDERSYITGFREKPMLPYWLNGGIYIFEPRIRELLPERGDHEETTFPLLAQQGQLLGYRTRAYWRPADTAKDVTELNRDLSGRDLAAFFDAAPADEP